MRKNMTTAQFIAKANAKHKNKFSYPDTVYLGRGEDITFVCPLHNEVTMTARGHMSSKTGCPRCSGLNNGQDLAIYQDKFKEKLDALGLEITDIDVVTGIARPSMKERTYITLMLRCHLHGGFSRTLSAVRKESFTGCPGCYSKPKELIDNQETFLRLSKEKHGNTYDYSKAQFIKYGQTVTINCKEHGEFEQQPGVHATGVGCEKCAKPKRVASRKQNVMLGVSL